MKLKGVPVRSLKVRQQSLQRNKALQAIFSSQITPDATIIRPVEEPAATEQ
ncbi:MAG TPA: hypothetical protein V6D33_07765 [Cyanophyceae cyanobacterium]